MATQQCVNGGLLPDMVFFNALPYFSFFVFVLLVISFFIFVFLLLVCFERAEQNVSDSVSDWQTEMKEGSWVKKSKSVSYGM